MSIKEQRKVAQDIGRVIQIFKDSRGRLRPHFIVTGPSGSGKTFLIEQEAKKANIPFIEMCASQLTKEGNSGNSLSKELVPLGPLNGQLVICLVDEFDKLFISGNSNNKLAKDTTTEVQNEFLKVLESTTTKVIGEYGHYDKVSVENVLFIFAGAFNGEPNLTVDRLRDFGIKTEFLGRVGILYNLEKISVNSMYQALKESENLNIYLEMFPDVDREDVECDIMEVVEAKHEENTTGIRLLNTLVDQYFINGGKLEAKQVEQTTFSTKLNFDASS